MKITNCRGKSWICLEGNGSYAIDIVGRDIVNLPLKKLLQTIRKSKIVLTKSTPVFAKTGRLSEILTKK
jgi:hypothetical protein